MPIFSDVRRPVLPAIDRGLSSLRDIALSRHTTRLDLLPPALVEFAMKFKRGLWIHADTSPGCGKKAMNGSRRLSVIGKQICSSLAKRSKVDPTCLVASDSLLVISVTSKPARVHM